MNIPPRQQRERAREYAIRVLRENIVSLTLEPGARVSENELATQLGLSRTPVREALIELSNYGIVEIYPQHGSIISTINFKMIEESRFMRMAMETAAVVEAIDLASPGDIEELEDNVQIQRMYLENGNTKMLLKMDNRFHRMLFTICDKMISLMLTEQMAVHFDRVRQLILESVSDIRIVEDHQNIVDAIKDRDKERAREQMMIHLSRYKVELRDVRKKYPHLFKE